MSLRTRCSNTVSAVSLEPLTHVLRVLVACRLGNTVILRRNGYRVPYQLNVNKTGKGILLNGYQPRITPIGMLITR